MADRFVPPPPTGRFDLPAWFAANVQAGDRVVFPKGASYRTEYVRLVGLNTVQIHGGDSVLVSTTPPPPPIAGVWKSPFDLVECSNVEVLDLLVRGPRPAGATFQVAYEGQHGFSVHRSENITLCRCGSSGQYGDHIYLAGGATNVIVCDHRGGTQSGRHGVATVDGADVLINGGEINALRTGFNFEVHIGESVKRWEANGVKLTWTLRAFTGTGEGEASDITIKNITCADQTRKMMAEVYGVGHDGRSGVRRNWSITDITGAKIAATPISKLHYIDGLKVENFPYPYTTTGSTLTP